MKVLAWLNAALLSGLIVVGLVLVGTINEQAASQERHACIDGMAESMGYDSYWETPLETAAWITSQCNE